MKSFLVKDFYLNFFKKGKCILKMKGAVFKVTDGLMQINEFNYLTSA